MTKSLKYFFILICCFTTQALMSQPIIPCAINKSSQRNGTVAICMMFQNEAKYLKEWVEYHKSIGVSHFYLYNHASTDHFWHVLMPYVLKGEVELFDLYEKTPDVNAYNNLQRQVYDHAVSLSRGHNEWLAIIDSDEFICMPRHNNLGKFLENYLYATSVALNWVMYGSSNVEELAPGELQIEQFVYRAPDDWNEHLMVKSIVRPQFVLKTDIHSSQVHPNMIVYANHQRYSHTPDFASPPIQDIRINHYWWRDEKYFREKKLPRRSSWSTTYNPEEIDSRRQVYNSVYDASMAPFVNSTRQNMLTAP